MENKEMELMEHLKDWVKNEREPRFWDIAKRVNILIMILDLPKEQKDFLVHSIVTLVKMAQMEAFHDGLKNGREEKARGLKR